MQPKPLFSVGCRVTRAMAASTWQEGTALQSHSRTLENSGGEHLWCSHIVRHIPLTPATFSSFYSVSLMALFGHIYSTEVVNLVHGMSAFCLGLGRAAYWGPDGVRGLYKPIRG